MTEAQIQKAIFRHLRDRPMPGVFAFHVPNNPRGRTASGFTAGLPDVLIVRHGQLYGLELKTEKGRASEAQFAAVENLRNAGCCAAIAHGLERALRCLEAWQLIRPEAA